MQSNSSQRLKPIEEEAAGTRLKVNFDYLLKMFFSTQNKSSLAVEQIGISILVDIRTERH